MALAIDMKEEGIRLSTLRHIARWGQDRLAELVGYADAANVSMIETGSRRLPDVKKRMAAEAFSMHPLFVDEDGVIYNYLNGLGTLKDCLSDSPKLRLVTGDEATVDSTADDSDSGGLLEAA